MARPLRINVPGGWYHITARGIERRAIFETRRDREHFLELAEMPGAANKSLRFKAEEGKCYFFKTEVGFARQIIELLSEEEGKELVKSYKQSGFNEFDSTGKDAVAVPGLNKN